MFKFENGVLSDPDFPYRNLVSTVSFGNMKDDKARKIFCEANSVAFGSIVTAQQVHGDKIEIVDENSKGLRIPNCDGLITQSKNLPLAIFTADCLSVFLGARSKPLIGVIHAGWRGIASGIVKKAVEIFEKKFSVKEKDIAVSIGPHIQKCCYEVSDDLKKLFDVPRNLKTLDLSSVVAGQLKELGINQVNISEHCTFHQPEMFFSFRRDKTESRMISLAEIK